MKQSMIEILCCCLCKGELKLKIETKSNENIIEGRMVCCNCKNEYLIHDGIPIMYISDNKIIALSNNSKFSKFIITPKSLDGWINGTKTRKDSNFLTNKLCTKLLVGFGWILLFFSVPLSILSYFNFNVAATNNVLLLVIYLFVCISVTFFIIDYLRYRTRAKVEFITNIHTLKKLLDKQKLSEYDIRILTKDKEENFKNGIANQRDFVAYKGKKIASVLNNYNFKVKTVLNMGCGGTLHKSVSSPYFDKGYDMIGVDISEEYLKQFNQIFNADVVQANSMALPFRSNKIDLINFTDLVEHLHHPLLGLKEAQRVLKRDGIIILTTDNHCRVTSRCINPLIFIEKVISLYFDGILPPRDILGQWMDFNFYHTEFTKNEISRLIKAAGFEIVSFETQYPNKDKLNKIFKKFPALKFMCSQFMIIGKKKTIV